MALHKKIIAITFFFIFCFSTTAYAKHLGMIQLCTPAVNGINAYYVTNVGHQKKVVYIYVLDKEGNLYIGESYPIIEELEPGETAWYGEFGGMMPIGNSLRLVFQFKGPAYSIIATGSTASTTEPELYFKAVRCPMTFFDN